LKAFSLISSPAGDFKFKQGDYMGYDIDAYYPDSGSQISSKDTINAAFLEAEKWLIQNECSYDGLISLGGLDCGMSKKYLQQAVGRTIDPSIGILSAEEIRKLADAANWPEPESVPPDELWGYWSARKFLEVCVEHGLGLWTN